jgi:hypothetical protein
MNCPIVFYLVIIRSTAEWHPTVTTEVEEA